jgi:hypothetical protein
MPRSKIAEDLDAPTPQPISARHDRCVQIGEAIVYQIR